jgi:hypothetical protein
LLSGKERNNKRKGTAKPTPILVFVYVIQKRQMMR